MKNASPPNLTDKLRALVQKAYSCSWRGDSRQGRVGQLDDVPELVDALAEASDGAVQVPQHSVNLERNRGYSLI